MGNSRFRFSLTLSNAWFYKMKDAEKARRSSPGQKTPVIKAPGSSSTTKTPVTESNPRCQPRRASYYFPSSFENSDTSSKKKAEKKNQRTSEKLVGLPSVEDNDYDGIPCAVKPVISYSSSCRFTSSATEIILDVRRKNSPKEIQESEDILKVQELFLRPILTKPAKSSVGGENTLREPGSTLLYRERRKSLKLQRKIRRKKFLSESFAVAKSSSDPGRDFKESMMEMILANDIRDSRDMEDLLACYLSLNSGEYHEIIVKAFEQIWFDLHHGKIRDPLMT